MRPAQIGYCILVSVGVCKSDFNFLRKFLPGAGALAPLTVLTIMLRLMFSLLHPCCINVNFSQLATSL